MSDHYHPGNLTGMFEPGNLTGMFELASAREVPKWRLALQGITLNLGEGNKQIIGSIGLDLPGWNADLNEIPFESGSVSAIYALHFLEHVKDPIRMLRECERVLMPGGLLNVGVPYYSAQIAFHDLGHRSSWCEETWRNLFSQPYYDRPEGKWHFEIGANVIMGLVERNLMLITQLIRTA